ncbi:MAG: hypothetical protein F4149_01330 [Gammaproteobacteria bacterium]|nr:hypothetical protein [Gammaproteobacteria bacterium]
MRTPCLWLPFGLASSPPGQTEGFLPVSLPASQTDTGADRVGCDRYYPRGCGQVRDRSANPAGSPLDEQQAIIDHLDRETARLDVLIDVKKRALFLLAEKFQALVFHAVTRGLEPHRAFRASGIPWVGKLPRHWEVWKLGHIGAVGNGSTPSRTNPAYWTNGTIPWLNSSVVNQHEVSEADQFVTDLAVRERHLPLVKRGSVLIAITGQGKTRGQAAVLSLDATVSQHLVYVSPDHSRLAPWFLKWTFLAAYDFLRRISDDAGGTKGALTCEDIHSLRVPVPPIKEQLQIVAHIREQASKLLELREGLEKTLSLLQERRSSLITEAVTGQLAVE